MKLAGEKSGQSDSPAASLGDQLAAANRVVRGAPAILHYLVSAEGHDLFSEELVARTRGLLASLALVILRTGADRVSRSRAAALVDALAAEPALLAHCHALALEGQLMARLAEPGGVDSVVPPLVQAAIASSDADRAAGAMRLLAAQARFAQAQLRMELPPSELPADLLHAALQTFVDLEGASGLPVCDTIRAGFDEGLGRQGLIGNFILGIDGGLLACLDPGQAGVSVFATALALATGHGRDAIVQTMSEGQKTRLALTLLGAGLGLPQTEHVLAVIHPDGILPEMAGLTREDALNLLTGDGA